MENIDQHFTTDAKSFRLKSGYCHVLPDKLVLSGSQDPSVIPPKTNNRIALALSLYVAMSAVILFQAYKMFTLDQTALGVVFALFSLLLLYGVWANRHNSTVNIIPREKIRKVTFRYASKGITRAFVQIHFQDDSGKLKRRLLQLPGSLSGGDRETEKAVSILRSEGWMEASL